MSSENLISNRKTEILNKTKRKKELTKNKIDSKYILFNKINFYKTI